MLIDLPDRVRWPEIIAKLEEMGVSNAKLARRLGMHRSAISALKSGDRKQPYFDNGVAILRVYVSVHQSEHQT